MSHLSDIAFDILVIGGGIHGASIAWDATLRGFKVALIEKNEFNSGATAGNYRIIHGGLRYLQHLDLPRLFESVEEQRIFRRIASHALKPLPFLIPCYGFGMRSPEILKAGCTLYDVLTFWRNHGVSPVLPNHQALSVEETLKIAPYLERKNLRGGIVYFDAQMIDPERLTLSFINSAAKRGAYVSRYTEATSATIDESSREMRGIRCRNSASQTEFEIRAKVVINAAGVWRSVLASKLTGVPHEEFIFSKGLQVTLPNLTGEHAVALESKFRDKEAFVSKGNRSYFLQPWGGNTIAGTADILHSSNPDTYSLKEEEIELFLKELREIYPDPRISRPNVINTFGGLRPVTPSVREKYRRGELENYGSIEVAHRDTVIVHAEEQGASHVKNLISVEGIKFTTTRRLAERVVNIAGKMLGNEVRSQTSNVPLDYDPLPEITSLNTGRA